MKISNPPSAVVVFFKKHFFVIGAFLAFWVSITTLNVEAAGWMPQVVEKSIISQEVKDSYRVSLECDAEARDAIMAKKGFISKTFYELPSSDSNVLGREVWVSACYEYGISVYHNKNNGILTFLGS